MHGNQDRIIPGNAAAVNSELPFRYVPFVMALDTQRLHQPTNFFFFLLGHFSFLDKRGLDRFGQAFLSRFQVKFEEIGVGFLVIRNEKNSDHVPGHLGIRCLKQPARF
jgi:hypothetical protein